MANLLSKAIGIWFILLAVAIANAGIRELFLAPVFGGKIALPVSGLLLSLLIFIVSYLTIPFFRVLESRMYFLIGVVWVALTLSFEFLFGHFVAGKPLQEILQVFNINQGNLFVVALMTTLIAPGVSAKLRGLI